MIKYYAFWKNNILIQGFIIRSNFSRFSNADVARFSLSVASDGMQIPEQVTASHVKAKKICFMPDKELKQKITNVEFKRKTIR